VAVSLPLGTDPRPYADAGATWFLTDIDPGTRRADVEAVVAEGPFR
jgi:hypothetical protein